MNRILQPYLVASLSGILLTVPVWSAETPYSSEEKARQALAVLLSDAPPQEKAVACKRLAVFGGPEAVPALAPLLANDLLASWARIPLEVIPGPAADEALRGALGQLRGNLLVGVINSIGARRDPKAVDPLVERLKDPDPEVASSAAAALGQIGGATAVRALEAALSSAPTAVRSVVAEGLIVVAERADREGRVAEAIPLYDRVRRAEVPLQRVLEATRGSILARGESGLPLLLETLRASDADTYAMGLRVARELPGRTTTEALAEAMKRTTADRQSAWLLALADRRDPAVAPAVTEAVTRGSKALRIVGIGILERESSLSSLPVLLDAASGSDADVSKAATEALGRMPGKEFDVALASRLRQASGSSRKVLVELAGKRRIESTVSDLFKAANEPDPKLRGAGIRSLGETVTVSELGALADLLAKAPDEDVSSEVESALDSACSRLGDKPAASAVLVARLPSSTPGARCSLLRVLGTAGSPNALAAVRASMSHEDAEVRDTAFRVLAEWPEANALPTLLDVVRAPKSETQKTLALRGAVRLLGLADQPLAATVKTYTELLTISPRVDDRKLLLSGLGKVGDPSAAKLVEPLLTEVSVRKEAEAALLGIGEALAKSTPAEARVLLEKVKSTSQDAGLRDRAGQALRRLK